MPLELAGVNNAGAASVATALRENKTLEHLDVSGRNAIDAIGVEQIADAIRSHPKLMTVKIEGATALTIPQVH